MANMEQSDVITTAGSQIFPQNLRTEFLLLCHKKHLAESQHNMVKDLPDRTCVGVKGMFKHFLFLIKCNQEPLPEWF